MYSCRFIYTQLYTCTYICVQIYFYNSKLHVFYCHIYVYIGKHVQIVQIHIYRNMHNIHLDKLTLILEGLLPEIHVIQVECFKFSLIDPETCIIFWTFKLAAHACRCICTQNVEDKKIHEICFCKVQMIRGRQLLSLSANNKAR